MVYTFFVLFLVFRMELIEFKLMLKEDIGFLLFGGLSNSCWDVEDGGCMFGRGVGRLLLVEDSVTEGTSSRALVRVVRNGRGVEGVVMGVEVRVL